MSIMTGEDQISNGEVKCGNVQIAVRKTMREFPDIDVQEYIFDFEKVNGACEEEIDKIDDEIIDHIDGFSKAHGIEQFCQWARIFI